MDFNKEIGSIQDKFEGLKTDLAQKQGALKNAVETLKKEHGVSDGKEAKQVIDKMNDDVTTWKAERDKILGELRRKLDEIDGVDTNDDFDDFE